MESAFVNADITTLFQTLKTFEEKEIVSQIEDEAGVLKYALYGSGCNCELDQELHLHFHCTHFAETICLTEQKNPRINLPRGYVAENANLVVKGKFVKCSG